MLLRGHIVERRWMTASSEGVRKQKMNMFTAINDAIRVAMHEDESVILCGEDVGFGGVFRCSVGLQQEFGKHRVFNTPLTGTFSWPPD